jgi:hypothetical protein
VLETFAPRRRGGRKADSLEEPLSCARGRAEPQASLRIAEIDSGGGVVELITPLSVVWLRLMPILELCYINK